jgi:uncharacterized protein DUF6894
VDGPYRSVFSNYGPRMRYYFHLRVGGTLSSDELGLELPDLDTAYLEAFRGAQEMWTELLAEGSDPFSRAFEIADADGRVLLTVPFREVLDRVRRPVAAPSNRKRELNELLEKRRALTDTLQQELKTMRESIEQVHKSLEAANRVLPLAFNKDIDRRD